jgi:hypothetical protein
MKEFFIEVIKEYCPDLNLGDIPTHPDDFLWYAERINGRIAMLTIVFCVNGRVLPLRNQSFKSSASSIDDHQPNSFLH